MRRPVRSLLTASITTFVALSALAACGSSKSATPGSGTTSTTASAPGTTGGGSDVTTAPTAATTATTAVTATAVALPADACKLFSDQEASTLAGLTERNVGHNSFDGERLCTWNATQGTGDHHVTLTVQAFADAAAAHRSLAAKKQLASVTNAPAKALDLGDEGIVAQLGPGVLATVRTGKIILGIDVSDFHDLNAVGTAITTVFGRL